MTTLAAEAEELAQREREWSASVEGRDSAQAAREERALADRTEALKEDVSAAGGLVDTIGMSTAPLADAAASAAEAEAHMRRAASQAEAAQASAARRSGEEASSALQRAGATLREARDRMRESWRAVTL